MNRDRQRRVATATIALGGLLGIFLAVADIQFAGIYRNFASSFKKTLSKPEPGLWFTGEWGFRTYLERAGGRELGRRDSSPRPHDLLIVPTLATPYQTLLSETLSLESMVLVAPSRIAFDIPQLPRDSVLACTVGMPFFDKSDGMEFSIQFVSVEEKQILSRKQILPFEGRQWRVHEVPLEAVSGKAGTILFTADVGPSGKADADWLAVARARIYRKNTSGDIPLYDFREHLNNDAKIEPEPGIRYHTQRNIPVFPLTVWLKQEPATVLRGTYDYRPAFPLRLLDGQYRAGFWSSGWGLLPFSIADGETALESISVYEIIRGIDSYGESTPSYYQLEDGTAGVEK